MCYNNYKNFLESKFGKPREGLHSYRFLDFAIIDILLTILLGIIIHKLFNYNIYNILIFLFLFAIIIHKILCIDTKLTLILFS